MKKFLGLIFALLFSAGVLSCQDVHTDNPVSVTWDPVTAYVDGTAITEVVQYEVFYGELPVDDRLTTNELVYVDITTGTEYTITLPEKRNLLIAVRTAIYFPETDDWQFSDLVWSDTDGEPPFVIVTRKRPNLPGRFRKN